MQGIRSFGGKRIVIFVIVPVILLALLIFLDQITKYYAQRENVNDTVIDGFFYLAYTLNSGAAFSFLADKTWGQTVFKIITPIALAAFVYFYVFAARKKYRWLSYSLILVIAGTVGNFIDRLASGQVVDFLSFHFGAYVFPTFNVADICLTVGVIMLLVHFCFFDENALFKPKKETAAAGGAVSETENGEIGDIKGESDNFDAEKFSDESEREEDKR